MPKLFLTSLLGCAGLVAVAQAPSTKAASATVNVDATDTKQKAIKGEEVVFTNPDSKSYTCRSGADGKTSITLPAGSVYTIKLKTLLDSTAYGSLEIPALQPNQFFTSPFSVVIEFEPPKSFTLDNV